MRARNIVGRGTQIFQTRDTGQTREDRVQLIANFSFLFSFSFPVSFRPFATPLSCPYTKPDTRSSAQFCVDHTEPTPYTLGIRYVSLTQHFCAEYVSMLSAAAPSPPSPPSAFHSGLSVELVCYAGHTAFFLGTRRFHFQRSKALRHRFCFTISSRFSLSYYFLFSRVRVRFHQGLLRQVYFLETIYSPLNLI